MSAARPMISARLPGEALVQLGALQLSHLYPPPTMTPEFLAPPPRPYPRYPPRRRDMPAPPAPAPQPAPQPYAPFLHHPSYAPYLYRPRAPAYPLRPRPTSGFVPPPPQPHQPHLHETPVSAPAPAPAPPPAPAPQPLPHTLREEGVGVGSPERGSCAGAGAGGTAHFRRGALIRLEDGSLRRVEEMRTEDFVMSAERCDPALALTQCTLLRLDERGDRLSLTFAYDRNRSQVELESTVEHPFFVYGRGWASCKPERTLARYGLQVQRLQVGDLCVSLVARKHAHTHMGTNLAPAPPQTHPENLSVKEDARKRRWSASDVIEEGPPLKKR